MKREITIHKLATTKGGIAIDTTNNDYEIVEFNCEHDDYEHYHLYGTVSHKIEPIKVEDKYIVNNILKHCVALNTYNDNSIYVVDKLGNEDRVEFCSKVVLTTDEKLTSMLDYHGNPTNDITKQCYNGLPQFDKVFLKRYCKAHGINYALVNYDEINEYSDERGSHTTRKLTLSDDNTSKVYPLIEKLLNSAEVRILFNRYNEFIAHNEPSTWENWLNKNL